MCYGVNSVHTLLMRAFLVHRYMHKTLSDPHEPTLYTNSCHAWEMSVLAHSVEFALERGELFPPVRTVKTPISQRHMLCRLLAVRPFENKTHSSRIHHIPMAGSLIPNLLRRLERKTHPPPLQ